MALPGEWAALEDFATLFQYFWHRDFPMGQGATGARRSDWTIHIGVAVRNIADLMGLVTRFERGGKKDAVLRSSDGDEIAIEWEWDGVCGNELGKLKNHRVWSVKKESSRLLKYAVFISYANTRDIETAYDHVKEGWESAPWPLLLVLIDWEQTRKLSVRKEFKHLNMSVFDSGEHRLLRVAPAFSWNVVSSNWWVQTGGEQLQGIEKLHVPYG